MTDWASVVIIVVVCLFWAFVIGVNSTGRYPWERKR